MDNIWMKYLKPQKSLKSWVMFFFRDLHIQLNVILLMKATWMLGVNHLGELIQQCKNEIWWKQNETEICRSKSFVYLQFVPPAEDTSSMSKRASHNRLRDLYNSSPSKKNVCLSQAKYNPHNWSLEAVEDDFELPKSFI